MAWPGRYLSLFLFLLLAATARPAAARDCSGGGSHPPRTAIPLFYATDRNDLGTGGALHWGKDTDERVHYGMVETSILRSCATLPASPADWWQPYTGPAEHPRRLFLVHEDHPLDDRDAMLARVDHFLRTVGGPRDVILFVHGYNQSFSEAGRDAAQLAMDLPFRGAPIFFAWPSQDSLGQYDWDETRAARAEPPIRDLIRAIVDQVHPEHFHIVAHSMGNRIVTAALLDLARERPDIGRKITSLTLLSPDIDQILFRRMTEGRLQTMAARITLFSNSRDRALALSDHHNGGMPLGRWHDSGEAGLANSPFVSPWMTTIDISRVSHSLTRHADFEEQAAIMREIAANMAGMPMGSRPCLETRQSTEGTWYAIDPARAGCPAAGPYVAAP